MELIFHNHFNTFTVARAFVGNAVLAITMGWMVMMAQHSSQNSTTRSSSSTPDDKTDEDNDDDTDITIPNLQLDVLLSDQSLSWTVAAKVSLCQYAVCHGFSLVSVSLRLPSPSCTESQTLQSQRDGVVTECLGSQQWVRSQLVLLRLRQSLFRSITIDLSKKIAMSMSIRCYTGMWTDNFPISAN